MDRQLHLLTGAYALNALDPAEREDFENGALASQDTLHEVRTLSETAARLAEQTTPVAPPPRVKANIMAAIRDTPQLPATSEAPAHPAARTPRTPEAGAPPRADGVADLDAARRRRTARTTWPTRILAGAAAALLLAAGALTGVVVNQNQQQDQLEQQLRALSEHQEQMQRIFSATDMKSATQRTDDGGEVTVAYSASAGLAALTTRGLPSLPSDKGYELWLIGEGGATPMGMLDTTGTTPKTTLVEGAMDQATHLGITVEPAQGSEQPTTAPILLQQL
ncbi:anti-sigma factor domain-containing protein [Arthrobacter sp. JSM 101049]|uniref:anti-sigma factor n=1 Tax=Arthrobacter sp. JSM 101049 TaxID=929097 RepID=UPI003563F0EA